MFKKSNFKKLSLLILTVFLLNMTSMLSVYGIDENTVIKENNIISKEIKMEALTLKVGENLDLNYYMYEKIQGLKWETSDKNIISVNENGIIEAKNNGTANIYAISNKARYKFLIIVSNEFKAKKYYSNSIERKNPDDKYRVFIDPGHGGIDPGTTGPTGLKEKDVTLDISKRVLKRLEENDKIIAKCSRTTDVEFDKDEDKDLHIRSKMANDFNADVCVCVHVNSFENPEVNGTETYYYESYNDTDIGSIQSKKLAQYVHNNLINNLKSNDRKLKEGNNLVLINSTNMPSILSEIDFISNPEIETKMKSEEYKESVANSIYVGILEYLNIDNEKHISVENVKLNKHELTLKKGQSEKLSLTIEPSNATDKKIRWSTSNKDVAMVDQSGNITAISKGTAIIKAISEDSQCEDSLNLKVTEDIVAQRISGLNRYKTNYEISKKGWKDGESEYVVIASGEDYADALCAVPLASQYKAPVLLSQKDAISNELINEIKRLGAKKAFIIGEKGAISKKVEDEIAKNNLEIERLGGKSRYETSILVAKKVNNNGIATVVTGNNYPDAVSIASIAASLKSPVILTNKDYLPNEVKNYMDIEKFNKTYVIGGEGAVSLNVEKQLSNTKRISGKNRYETNRNIINEFQEYIDYNDVYLAIGSNYPDALSCSALAGKNRNAVMLTDGNTNNFELKNFIESKKSNISEVFVIGTDKLISNEYLLRNGLNIN